MDTKQNITEEVAVVHESVSDTSSDENIAVDHVTET